MAAKNNTVRQVRLPDELVSDVDAVFQELHISFSEGVRLFLTEVVKQQNLPFRPSQDSEDNLIKVREKENAYLDQILGTGLSAEERLKRAIFGPENGSEMSDEQLKEWARNIGLPDTLSTSTLEELFDSGLFPQNAFSGGVSVDLFSDELEDSAADDNILTFAHIENIRSNLDKVADKLKARAISSYLQNLHDDNVRIAARVTKDKEGV